MRTASGNASGDFEKASIIRSWEIGGTTSEACRVWIYAPDSALLDSREVQTGYLHDGVDHEGQPIPGVLRSLLRFLDRATRGGAMALRVAPFGADDEQLAPNYIIVRHPRQHTWVALIEEWREGISIYSRWAHVATINRHHPASEQDFAELIRHAQRLSSEQPNRKTKGRDYIDPERPVFRDSGEDRVVHPPDIVDRIVGWIRDFF